MKTNYSEERRAFIGSINRGKCLSEYTKNLLIQKALVRCPRVFSEQALSNMKKMSKIYNKNGTIYGEYSSITSASVNVRCSVKTITRALQSKSKILKRR